MPLRRKSLKHSLLLARKSLIELEAWWVGPHGQVTEMPRPVDSIGQFQAGKLRDKVAALLQRQPPTAAEPTGRISFSTGFFLWLNGSAAFGGILICMGSCVGLAGSFAWVFAGFALVVGLLFYIEPIWRARYAAGMLKRGRLTWAVPLEIEVLEALERSPHPENSVWPKTGYGIVYAYLSGPGQVDFSAVVTTQPKYATDEPFELVLQEGETVLLVDCDFQPVFKIDEHRKIKVTAHEVIGRTVLTIVLPGAMLAILIGRWFWAAVEALSGG